MQKLSLFVVCCVIMLSSCHKCEIKPDLISDLLAPTTNIILGEPVDWEYKVISIKDNSSECKILKTESFIGSVIVERFVNPADTTPESIINNTDMIEGLCPGEEKFVNFTIVFDSPGIYLIRTTADYNNKIPERNEDNNDDRAEEMKSLNVLKEGSLEFITKLENASAIVIVGSLNKSMFDLKSYKGKNVYYIE